MWTSGIGKISLFITLVAFVLGYGEFAAHPHAAASVHGAVERGMPGTQDIDNIPIYTPHNSHESRDRINNYGGDASENLGNVGDHLDTIEANQLKYISRRGLFFILREIEYILSSGNMQGNSEENEI